jgi:hypothetical protein
MCWWQAYCCCLGWWDRRWPYKDLAQKTRADRASPSQQALVTVVALVALSAQ